MLYLQFKLTKKNVLHSRIRLKNQNTIASAWNTVQCASVCWCVPWTLYIIIMSTEHLTACHQPASNMKHDAFGIRKQTPMMAMAVDHVAGNLELNFHQFITIMYRGTPQNTMNIQRYRMRGRLEREGTEAMIGRWEIEYEVCIYIYIYIHTYMYIIYIYIYIVCVYVNDYSTITEQKRTNWDSEI